MISFLCDKYMNKLKEIRLENHLSQKETANLFNISQTCYSNYEIEKRDLSTDMLISISNYYNLSIDYLLCLTNNKKRYNISLIKRNKGINRLK